MKFLGLRLCEHDSNMSYFDGEEIYYFKLERHSRKKHDAYENYESWVDEIYKMWRLKPKDIDEIGIVFDPWHYKLDVKNDNFFPEKKFNYLPYHNMTRVNHHYAHALSSWPIVHECKNHFVFDAYGDYNISWSFFQNDKLVDLGFFNEQNSLGNLINTTASFLGIQAEHGLDRAGKLMGLQSYGRFDREFYKKLKIFNIKTIAAAFNIDLWVQHCGDELIASHTKLNWIRTLHQYVGDALVKHFKDYIKTDEHVTFSGGCAQNVVWNSQIKKVFKNLHVFPHCSDEGLSLGILEFLRKKHELPRFKNKNFPYWQIYRHK
tara:strand:- start:588 stop:1544 length:957 start_codon:yes stop_codon:yes gene_type:complete